MESKKENKFLKYMSDTKVVSVILFLLTIIFSTSFVGIVATIPRRFYVIGITCMAVLVITGLLAISMLFVLASDTIKYSSEKEKGLFNIDNLYIELRIIILALVCITIMEKVDSSYVWNMWQDYLYFPDEVTIDFATITYHIIQYTIYDAIFVFTYTVVGLSIIRSIKNKNIKTFSGEYIKKSVSQMKSFFNESRYKNNKFKEKLHKRQRNYLLCIVCLTFLSMYFSFFHYDFQFLGFLFMFSTCVVTVLFILRQDKMTDDVDKIVSQIDEISNGNLYTTSNLDIESLLYSTGKKLNEIQNGFQKSVEQKIKSERTKIELVTNVSHDLKTPLTSIISYIELLDKEDLSPECRDYVNVLKNKSERLKNMVSDLFTLAKVTSGEQSLELMELDFTKLVQQTLGDMEDVIEKSAMILRINITEEETKIMGDGNKLYRSIQNIIDNALKYGLSGTRIFLDVEKQDDFVKLELKNTSANEITYTVDEILERFARGDESRTTDGNGLGLSIAKGFVETIGGTFDLILDGDQFKVIIKIPLIKTEEKGKGVEIESEDIKDIKTILPKEDKQEEMTLIEKVSKIEDDKLKNKKLWKTLKK